jgi:hyaluronan synthase
MPANLALTSKHRYFLRPRRLADLDRWLKIAVPLFLLASLFIALDSGFFNTYLRLFQRNTYTSLLSAVGAVYALAFLTMQTIRTVLWWRYRPYSVPAGPLPPVTVLIPAYNEGAMVEKALQRYPHLIRAIRFPKNRGKREALYAGFLANGLRPSVGH